ncbi:hypothetical protein GGR51DRAFT_558173 [Nemania sp. FL0031]|nr:hypothetical protein GGR51DRAFT_558173 [Nemania sp. FL0031]
MTDSGSKNSDGYRLGRSYLSASRLNLQHFLWKDAQSFLLHPVIQAKLRQRQESRQPENTDSISIVDLATGTGIWLFDLVKSPEVKGLDVHYHGFDISKALFPHKSWLPKNIALSVSDLFKEPPPSFHGQFDVVHIRLVLSLVRSGNLKPIIQHIKMLLKPGGYLQWDELDLFNHYDVLVPNPGTSAPNMAATFQRIKDLANWSWVAKLPEMLLEEGFKEAVQSYHEPKSELFKAWTHMDLCSAEELSIHWSGPDDEDGKNWRDLIPIGAEEADESIGAVLRVRPTVTIARKLT